MHWFKIFVYKMLGKSTMTESDRLREEYLKRLEKLEQLKNEQMSEYLDGTGRTEGK